ncbi:RCC1 domain-containing protein [Schistosoma japonicum]|uniref:Putative E3 ubiquitin-protein ligase HERC5 n=1 Tax=Schistosoma japonicum TaxID=6182 RepID=C1LGT4_SCHJA|nr:RCC1 domain-containing protein [Schistosoma japonicum]CAX73912.1 putative E3 ubiquitin-protein ligase HERC5 [Schistosoma japonicum]
MKNSESSLVLTSGVYRHHNGEWKSTFEFNPAGCLVFADWHCSLFSHSTAVCTLHGLLQEKDINLTVLSIGSNDSLILIATPESIIAVEKNYGNKVSANISGVTQVASDGHNIYCLRDETVYLLNISKLDEIIAIDRPLALRIKIKSVSCGLGFLLCLTCSGQVFSQGIGSRGQLGLGDLNDRTELTIIEALQTLTVTQISTGHWHSACLTDTGDVYTWGWNEHGQLGHKSLGVSNKLNSVTEQERKSCVSVLSLPTPVDFPDEPVVSQVTCGGCHTVCLTEDGILFCFGCNKFGQLGFDSSMEAVDTPVKHPILTAQNIQPNMTISSVYCGVWSTTLYLSSKT